jgi:hypothetical protein
VKVVVVVLAVVGLAAAGCGDGDRVSNAEEGIAAVIADRMGDMSKGGVDVSCPADADLVAGATMTCGVRVDGADAQAVDFTVTGDGEIALQSAAVPTSAAEAFLVDKLEASAGVPVAVDCGDDPLIVRAVGGTFTCEATRSSDGSTFAATVKAVTVGGELEYQVVPGPTTTVPTTPSSSTTSTLPAG